VAFLASFQPPKLGDPIVGYQQLLTQYIPSHSQYLKAVPDPQSEDAPCRGDRDTLTMAVTVFTEFIYVTFPPFLNVLRNNNLNFIISV
jgi:hypothetical protein